jgi:hypothetical protein
MPGMEWIVELILIVLLVATLVQAVRLERALGVLKRDRSALESLVAGFNSSTRQAESGIERLRAVADGAGRQIERQVAASVSLKDDLSFLTERGDRLADRLDHLVRAARPLAAESAAPAAVTELRPVQAPLRATAKPPRSAAEQGLLQALRLAR